MATVHQERTLLYRRTVKAQGEESRHGRDAVSKVKRVDILIFLVKSGSKGATPRHR